MRVTQCSRLEDEVSKMDHNAQRVEEELKGLRALVQEGITVSCRCFDNENGTTIIESHEITRKESKYADIIALRVALWVKVWPEFVTIGCIVVFEMLTILLLCICNKRVPKQEE